MITRHITAVAIGVATILAASTGAAATVWSSQVAFDAANPGLNQVSFSFGSQTALPNGSTFGGASFSANHLTAVPVGDAGSTLSNLADNTFGGYITTSFAASDAVALLISQGYTGSSGPISIVAYDGASVVYSGSPTVGGLDSFSFFGLTGAGPITSVTVSTGASPQFPAIAGVEFGNAVPEPATWAMMLLGVGLVGGGLRRARRQNPMALAAV